MIIRSAISFKLAGIDKLSLSYGIIESFVEFLINIIDEIKEEMDITTITIGGSLLENKKIFTKITENCSANYNLYFKKHGHT